jgi:hypothetical protein
MSKFSARGMSSGSASFLAAIGWVLLQGFRRPYFLSLEALGNLHELPEVGACVAWRIDKLMPELCAPLGIAVGKLLLDPHAAGRIKSAACAVTLG